MPNDRRGATDEKLAAERSFDAVVREHLLRCPGHSARGAKDIAGFLERLRFLSVGLGGEVGEAQNMIKKEWRGDRAIKDAFDGWMKELEEEIVDGANYISMLAAHLEIDLKNRQRQKLEAVEQRPEWKQWQNRMLAPEVPFERRNHIHLEFDSDKQRAFIPVDPLGSIVSRIVPFGERFCTPVVSYRTSKETIERLKVDGGVIDEVEGVQYFMGARIRAWGDYS